MAQYGHNFYGTTYYGRTNAFSGWYETREIFTDELLKNTVTINMRTALPSATYGPQSKEVQQVKGTWSYVSSQGKIQSDTPNAELLLGVTSDEVTIKYEQRTIAASVTIEVTSTPVDADPTVQTFTLNTQAASVDANATYKITGLPFGEQRVRIILGASNPSGSYFNFKGFVARTANITVESRARLDQTPWPTPSEAAYVKIPATVKPIAGSTDYMVTATTPNYAGKNQIQFRIFLASSDNETTPEVQYIETIAGDSNNRTEDGQWWAIFNMVEIAVQAGVSFSQVEEVNWTEEVPATTTMTVRSQSSVDKLNIWDKVTVPYKQNTNRIRLKEGFLTGWIDSPFIAPSAKVPYVTTTEWDKWDDQSFLPPDSAGVSVTYDFLSTQRDNTLNPYVRLSNPMNIANRNLRGTNLRNKDNVLRVTLKRTRGKQTPVVDWVTMTSEMHYEQDVVTEGQEFSAVDFKNTGKGVMLDMNPTAFRNKFKIPAATSNPEYTLIDNTRRPQDVILYLDSEKDAAIRTNKTMTLSNKVWAEAKVKTTDNGTGLQKNFQYGGGQVKFPLKDQIQLAPIFTPSLSSTLRYRYHLETGWPTQYHTVAPGDSMLEIAQQYQYDEAEIRTLNPKATYTNTGDLMEGQEIELPNDSVNDDVKMYWSSTNNERTDKSSHNAVLEGNADVSSDMVTAEVKEASIYGWVDWVSEEKIYDGVVNLNDVRSEYKRSHISPDSGDSAQVEYIAKAGDTYKNIANQFGVYEEDVRRLNNITVDDEQPAAGQRVMVPSRIVLPAVHPKAVVEDNPYHIEIVYNSVKKKDSKTLSEDVMTVKPIEITYKTVTMQDVEITRGEIENGKDLLPNARVISITQARNISGTRIYNPYNETTKSGDFKLTDNHIDWIPASSPASEPAANERYVVDYVVEVPSKVTVTIDTTYIEEGGVDRIWRSPEVKEFSGMCYPGYDYVAELPAFTEWLGMPDNAVEDIAYVIEDNDIWVKTWAEERDGKWYVIGSLQDRVPKDNWFPTIKTGYYYLGQDEYYLYNEPIVIEPTERDIPIAANVEFVSGKYQNAAALQESSVNKVLNSGFDVQEEERTVFKLSFDSNPLVQASTSAELGITN